MMQSIEPMTMGSPPNHPSGPAGHGMQHAGTFLPSYLMGDSHQSSPGGSRSWMSGSSPPRGGMQRRSMIPPPAAHAHMLNNSSRLDASFPGREAMLGSTVNTSKERTGAPPSVGLMESFTASSSNPDVNQLNTSILNQSVGQRGGVRDQLSGGRGGDSSFFNTSRTGPPPSPSRNDTFYSHSNSMSVTTTDDMWITVFGFPPAATSYILEEFSQYGNIVKHIISASGNWMHVRYQSRIQARKALSKNGKVFAGNIMIGVLPCLDKENGLDASSPQSNSLLGGGGGLDSSDVRPATQPFTRIRPLTVNNQPPTGLSAQQQMLEEDGGPQKNSSVISKAMEFVFGW